MALNVNRKYCKNISFSAYDEQGKCNYCQKMFI